MKALDRVTNIIIGGRDGGMDSWTMARQIIAALKELPEEPGPRYSAGEYSRRNIEAFVADALS